MDVRHERCLVKHLNCLGFTAQISTEAAWNPSEFLSSQSSGRGRSQRDAKCSRGGLCGGTFGWEEALGAPVERPLAAEGIGRSPLRAHGPERVEGLGGSAEGGERSGNRRRPARTGRGWEGRVLPGLPEVALGLGEVLDESDRSQSPAASVTAESVEIPHAAQKLRPWHPRGGAGGRMAVWAKNRRRHGPFFGRESCEEKIPSWRRSAKRGAGRMAARRARSSSGVITSAVRPRRSGRCRRYTTAPSSRSERRLRLSGGRRRYRTRRSRAARSPAGTTTPAWTLTPLGDGAQRQGTGVEAEAARRRRASVPAPAARDVRARGRSGCSRPAGPVLWVRTCRRPRERSGRGDGASA